MHFSVTEKIIHFLKRNEGYLSGEEISHVLNVSRSAIWKHVQELRNQGYDIIAVPHLGYKLISSPDKLLPEEIQYRLKTKAFGKKVVYHETVTSTMDEAFSLGLEGAPEGTIICAESQTKGRGRLGRSWVSPKGKGLYFSLILRPKLPPSEVASLTLLCAVAACEAIKNLTGVNVQIKWPNDLLVRNKKLAGILTEMNAETDKVKFVIVGFGINVNSTKSSLPDVGTSLKNETNKTVSRVKLIHEILESIEKWYSLFNKKGLKPVITRWKELSLTLGKRVRVSDPGGKIEGEAINIDEDGGLLIREDSGLVIKKMAGDVILTS